MFDAQAKDTICALSTPPGHGGIAVIRVSGSESLALVRKSCPFLPPELKSHTIHHTRFLDQSGQLIDDPLILFFEQGKSYTGEETVEISCHGGSTVSQLILNCLISSGARPAQNGEFTYRAFLNGRLDLVQAESVLELIQANSQPAVARASRNLEGELSKIYRSVEDLLVWSLAQLEASIDFSTEDIDYVDLSGVEARLIQVIEKCQKLVEGYKYGKALREGFNVVILGLPNAGKSSLLNALIQKERAIVTEIAGTTRDIIEAEYSRNGILFRFFDTAGIRETEDRVEKMGVQRALQVIDRADAIIWVVDPSDLSMADSLTQSIAASAAPVLVFSNKSDIILSHSSSAVSAFVEDCLLHKGYKLERGSTFDAKSLEGLWDWLLDSAGYSVYSDHSVVSQSRHIHLLNEIIQSSQLAIQMTRQSTSPELVAFELQDSVRHIHEILGKEFHEQVIDRIFKEFCLGK